MKLENIEQFIEKTIDLDWEENIFYVACIFKNTLFERHFCKFNIENGFVIGITICERGSSVMISHSINDIRQQLVFDLERIFSERLNSCDDSRREDILNIIKVIRKGLLFKEIIDGFMKHYFY